MPSSYALNLKEGSRSEILADYLFSQWGAVTPDRNQLAHALDTRAALQKYYFSDLLVDAVSPVSSRFWPRASTFCKAPLKKSASRVFSANNCFKRWISLR